MSVSPLNAWAGEPDIIFVPYAPKDLSLAAPAHENPRHYS